MSQVPPCGQIRGELNKDGYTSEYEEFGGGRQHRSEANQTKSGKDGYTSEFEEFGGGRQHEGLGQVYMFRGSLAHQ